MMRDREGKERRVPVALLLILFLLVTIPLPLTGQGDAAHLTVTSRPSPDAVVGQEYEYRVETNLEGVDLTLSVHPEGMRIEESSILWTPGHGQEGDHEVELLVSHGRAGYVKQNFLVTVYPSRYGKPEIVILHPREGERLGDAPRIEGVIGVPDIDGPAILMFSFDGEDWRRIELVTGRRNWSVDASGLGAGDHRFRARVQIGDGPSSDEVNVTFSMRDRPLLTHSVMTATTPLLIIGVVLGLVSFTEIGKFKIFTIFLIPLYSKIRKDEVLDHFVRGKIYQFIERNPGETYSTIKRALDLKNGNLSHHLSKLEHGRLIHSARNGIFRHFFPRTMPIPKVIFRLNHAQKDIVEVVRDRPGINQKELAETIGLTPATVNYHLGYLIDAGMVFTERVGNTKKCYLRAMD